MPYRRASRAPSGRGCAYTCKRRRPSNVDMRSATQRATDLWKLALAEYEQPALDPAVREALDAYVAERRSAIGSGEP